MIEVIEKWTKETAQAIIDNHNSMGLKASGSFEKSIESIVAKSNNGFNSKIKSAPHGYYMENGRGQTSQSKRGRLYGVILKWVEDKGINIEEKRKKSFAYLVARKIDEQGIKIPNTYNSGGVVSKVITKERIKELADSLKTPVLTQVRSEVIKKWQ